MLDLILTRALRQLQDDLAGLIKRRGPDRMAARLQAAHRRDRNTPLEFELAIGSQSPALPALRLAGRFQYNRRHTISTRQAARKLRLSGYSKTNSPMVKSIRAKIATHNPEVAGSNPAPATFLTPQTQSLRCFCYAAR